MFKSVPIKDIATGIILITFRLKSIPSALKSVKISLVSLKTYPGVNPPINAAINPLTPI